MEINEALYISIFAATALILAIYIVIRQRNENARYERPVQYDLYNSVVKPRNYVTQAFDPAGPILPTFAPQEAAQRKIPFDMNNSSMNQRNFGNLSGFGDRDVSRFETRSNRDINQSKLTERPFEDFQKQAPYEPSRQEIEDPSGFRPSWRQQQTDQNFYKGKPDNSMLPPTYQGGLENKNSNYPQTRQSMVEENQPQVDKHSNLRNSLYDDDMDLEKEYEVFKDFKLREKKNFIEELKKDESPNRVLKGLTGLDKVGHSPDSPFKIFESPAGSKKKIVPGQQDIDKINKPIKLLANKDSFSRTQEALNQKSKPQAKPPLPKSRFAPMSAAQKAEKKQKSIPDFMEPDNSGDDIQIEERKGSSNQNKRPLPNSRSIDNIEESSNRKLLKDNEQQPKEKREIKKMFLRTDSEIAGTTKKDAQKPYPKKSSGDLVSMSEYGVNKSMKKYIDKKLSHEGRNKLNKSPTSNQHSKAMNIEQPSHKPTTIPRGTEKPQPEEKKPVVHKEEKKPTAAGNSFQIAKDTKPEPEQKPINKKETLAGATSLKPEKKDESVFANISKPTETTGGAKIASFLSGTSIFSQSNPKESGLFSTITSAPKIEIPKSETRKEAQPAQKEDSPKEKDSDKEKEKETASKGDTTQQKTADIFKTIRPGGVGFLNNDASKEKTNQGEGTFSFLNKETKGEKEGQKSDPPKSSLFSGTFGATTTKNQEEDSSKTQDQKTEQKPALGLFANINSQGLFAASSAVKQTDTKADSTANQAQDSSSQKTSLFVNLQKEGSQPGGLFSSLNSSNLKAPEKKEEAKPGLFSNFGGFKSVQSNDNESKKDSNPLAAFAQNPLKSDDTKPTGNNSFGSSGGSGLFANSGSSGMFANLNKSGGLFSNLGNTTTPKE